MRARTTVAAILIALVVACVPQAATAASASFSVTCNGGGCSGGWYRSTVTVTFHYSSDTAVASTSGCGPNVVNTDTHGKTFTCTVNFKSPPGGGAFSSPVTIKRDATPPSVSASPDRGPDANGWYNHPVHVAFSGTDATSGVASCTSADYKGPDSATASVTGSCTDNAGNTASVSFALKYDSTPPKLTNVLVTPGDGFVDLKWKASKDTTSIQVVRTPGTAGADPSTVYTGLASGYDDKAVTNKVKYSYTITAVDEAGNTATKTIAAVPASALFTPLQGATVKSRPMLTWKRVPRATYYNVQIYRGSRQVLSSWPLKARFRVPATWTFHGKRQRLTPGVYQWGVFPGFGRRTQHRFGTLLGHSEFVVKG